jgi:hypothetical protein
LCAFHCALVPGLIDIRQAAQGSTCAPDHVFPNG